MKLSILIPSTHSRRNTFLPKALEMVYGQWEGLDIKQQNEVEILFLVDNKKMALGTKRNELVDIAQGEYVVFVDDDDRIEPNYISTLLEAIEMQPDVVTFLASVSINGAHPKICNYSTRHERDFNSSDAYLRLPNHICCVKRSIAIQVDFLPVLRGEDADYAKKIKPFLKDEVHISQVLYHYDFNSETTETQERLRPKNIARERRQHPYKHIRQQRLIDHYNKNKKSGT